MRGYSVAPSNGRIRRRKWRRKGGEGREERGRSDVWLAFVRLLTGSAWSFCGEWLTWRRDQVFGCQSIHAALPRLVVNALVAGEGEAWRPIVFLRQSSSANSECGLSHTFSSDAAHHTPSTCAILCKTGLRTPKSRYEHTVVIEICKLPFASVFSMAVSNVAGISSFETCKARDLGLKGPGCTPPFRCIPARMNAGFARQRGSS